MRTRRENNKKIGDPKVTAFILLQDVARMQRSGIRGVGNISPDSGPTGLHPGYSSLSFPRKRD